MNVWQCKNVLYDSDTIQEEIGKAGLFEVFFQKIMVTNFFACSDNASPMDSVPNAVVTGNVVGKMTNNGMNERRGVLMKYN
ncbi:hypothetical protein GCM10023231_30720 [Olivibacter ginsenosidimutans]|uniref:Uncharacterized protein n=1 Tax=Olivibacter ginsenosidimutans TaxID=1176537 RepID=A0ABP9BT40_9SPHI